LCVRGMCECLCYLGGWLVECEGVGGWVIGRVVGYLFYQYNI